MVWQQSIMRIYASVRKQLSETKQAASPKKAAARSKQHEMEVWRMNFSVEEENLICMYHTSDRRRTMARMLAALPDMDTEMRRLVNGTIAKLERMTSVNDRYKIHRKKL